MNRSDWVADASAILAALKSEPITNIDPDSLIGTSISSVNLSEVVRKLIADGIGEDYVDEAVSSMDLRVVPFDYRQAVAAARLWTRTRSAGLSLADRACVGLGIDMGLPVVTADRAWSRLDIEVEIIQIR